MSPFIDDSKEGYVPTRQREINQLKGDVYDEESGKEEEDEEEEVVLKVEAPVQSSKQLPAGKQAKVAATKGDADSSSDEESEEDNVDKKRKEKQ